MILLKQVNHLFSINGMIKPNQIQGNLPQTKEIYKTFLKVAWPSAIEALLVALIGTIDTVMVGSLGSGAIAAVGVTNQPRLVLLAMIFSLNVGITAIIARRKGQQDMNGANCTLRAGIILSTVISLTMSVLGYLFAKPILLFSGAETSYLKDALDFFQILMVSIFFTSLNLTINAAWRGIGKTQISMRTNIVANIITIIFDFLLINGIGIFPKLGVKGSGVATCLGAIAACLMSIISLLNKEGYLSLLRKYSWKINKKILQPILNVSGSSFIEQVFMRIGFLAYAIIVSKLGTTAFEAHLICMNILNLSFCFGDGLAIAASSLVGQNLGAKRPDISIIYGKTGQRIAFIVSTFLFIFFILNRTLLVSLFSKEAAIITLGSSILILLAFTTHVQTSQVVFSGCLRGAGDTVFVAITSIISVAVIRPLLTWILCFPAGLGLYGAWTALILDQTFRFLICFLRFSNGKWTKIVL
jgi:putative MATE family efflux protein